ncbi:hypothetical protein [Metallosphaera javensis (ex Sakai et al. 2022)]
MPNLLLLTRELKDSTRSWREGAEVPEEGRRGRGDRVPSIP